MAIAIIFEGPGVTQQQYEQVKGEVMPDEQHLPRGLRYHIGGPMENGWRVVEVWDSEEDARSFFESTLNSALTRANISTQPQMWQVHKILQPTPVRAG